MTHFPAHPSLCRERPECLASFEHVSDVDVSPMAGLLKEEVPERFALEYVVPLTAYEVSCLRLAV